MNLKRDDSLKTLSAFHSSGLFGAQICNFFSGAGLEDTPDAPGFVPSLNPSVGVVMEMGHTCQGSLSLWEPLVLNIEDRGWATHTRKNRIKNLG